MIQIRQNGTFPYGYTAITNMEEIQHNTMMDFGVLRLAKASMEKNTDQKERAYLLIQGEVTFQWEGHTKTAKRANCFDEDPWVLHVPQNVEVIITGISEDSELAVTKTTNEKIFLSLFLLGLPLLKSFEVLSGELCKSAVCVSF